MRWFSFILILFAFACVERYIPEYQSPVLTNQLIVEGTITQNEPIHEIILTRAFPIGSEETFDPESFAQVMILDEQNSCYEFIENFREAPGIYQLDSSRINLKLNESYQLKIILDNGEEYFSDYQLVPEQPTFSEVELRLEKGPGQVSNEIKEVEILSAYASSEITDESKFYRFGYDGVYVFRSPYQGSPNCRYGITSYTQMNQVEVVDCFKYDDKRNVINILRTDRIEVNSSFEINLFQIASDNNFAFGYAMNIYFFGINESFYRYLSEVEDQMELEGSLFETPPTQIKGNIQSESDGDALGYFTIQSASIQKAFIDSLFFQETIIDELNYYICQTDINDPYLADGIPRIPPARFCCDCRIAPDVIEKPDDFWPDE